MIKSCQKILLVLIIALSLCAATARAEDTPAAAPPPKVIAAFGDSLTAGYGIPLDKSFPAQLEKRLNEQGINVKVINAGVSGDTTADGVTRLKWLLKQKPDYVILELGANDMLRALDPAMTKQNLEKIIETLKKKKIPVLLAGMKATPNLGQEFVDSYRRMYQELAEHYGAVYYPFFLDKVATHPALIQQDGLHPNAEGVAVIIDHIMPAVKKLLKKK